MVLQSNIKPPRVGARQKLQTIAEEPKENPLGTIVRKKIGKIIQKGTINRYNKEWEYYWIDYKNGNSEEMTWSQVNSYKFQDQEPDLMKKH